MAVKEVEKKRKKQKPSKHKKLHGKKGHPSKGKKHGSKPKHAKRGSKSRSKSKKKSGFLCCQKKTKKRSKKSKSRTTKQPVIHPLPPKPLPPVPNEQLGEVVLVKSAMTPEIPPPQKQEPQVPKKDELNPPKTTSDVKVDLPKEKRGSEKDRKIEKEEKVEKVVEPAVEEPAKIQEEKVEKEEIKSEKKKKKKRKIKYAKYDTTEEETARIVDEVFDQIIAEDAMKQFEPFAKQVVSSDYSIPFADFNKVAGYIPAGVTKNSFVSNMSKNRFVDVICMDHSRVSLDDSTYIHASWVDLDIKRKAIVTQFPLRSTASDFWQMLIERKVKCVLLIMTDREYKKYGGDNVFPMTQDFISFEDRSIRVGEFKRLEMGKGWTLRVLSITNGDYKGYIHIHHLRTWSHDSIPSDEFQFWKLQTYLQKYTESPVYMSLSGCGRAGTFAFFETVHASLHANPPSVDMIKCLEKVRDGRLHSVQNRDQFTFVYNSMAEHILGRTLCKETGGAEPEDSTVAMLRQLTTE